MEGSESEAVFGSLNLNPQLFLNEVLNGVDDLVDEAFQFYQQEASVLLKTDGTDRSENLTKGIAYIRKILQGNLIKRLGMWEKYCLGHCFVVPEGFSLPKDDELPGDSSIDQHDLNNSEMDAQLESLRSKLTLVGKESAELNREVQVLERQSVLSNSCAASVNEALELFEQNSGPDMFEEIMKAASELRKKMETLRSKRMEEVERIRAESIYNPNKDLYVMGRSRGLSSAELKDLEEFVADLEKM